MCLLIRLLQTSQWDIDFTGTIIVAVTIQLLDWLMAKFLCTGYFVLECLVFQMSSTSFMTLVLVRQF